MVQTLHDQYGLIRQSTNLIMLIEDDMDHAELIIRASTEVAIRNQIIHFHDGQSALDYLFRPGEVWRCDPNASSEADSIGYESTWNGWDRDFENSQSIR